MRERAYILFYTQENGIDANIGNKVNLMGLYMRVIDKNTREKPFLIDEFIETQG